MCLYEMKLDSMWRCDVDDGFGREDIPVSRDEMTFTKTGCGAQVLIELKNVAWGREGEGMNLFS